MTIELVVMIFDQDEDVPSASRGFQILRDIRPFGLENAILVEQDVTGKAHIHQYKRYPSWKLALDDTFLNLFTNAIFSEQGDDGELDSVFPELDESFVQELKSAWQPGSSALLIFIQRESLVDVRRIMNYLSQYSGTLVHTTFPIQIIESILEQSKKKQPARK